MSATRVLTLIILTVANKAVVPAYIGLLECRGRSNKRNMTHEGIEPD